MEDWGCKEERSKKKTKEVSRGETIKHLTRVQKTGSREENTSKKVEKKWC